MEAEINVLAHFYSCLVNTEYPFTLKARMVKGLSVHTCIYRCRRRSIRTNTTRQSQFFFDQCICAKWADNCSILCWKTCSIIGFSIDRHNTQARCIELRNQIRLSQLKLICIRYCCSTGIHDSINRNLLTDLYRNCNNSSLFTRCTADMIFSARDHNLVAKL